jgi:hypothetical protein
MRRTWLWVTSAGVAALAMWPSEAMARSFYCHSNGLKEYTTDLFQIPDGYSSSAWEDLKHQFTMWLIKDNARFPNAGKDAFTNHKFVRCEEKKPGDTYYEQLIRGKRYVPTGWVPSMGRGTAPRTSATPAPRSRAAPAPPPPRSTRAPAPSVDEVANSARLNAQQAAAAKRQREQIEATLAAKRAADAKHLSDKAKYQRDKAAIEAENARRAAAYKAAQADYERKLVEHKAAVEAMKGKKAAKGEDCRFETRQKLASGQAKALADAKSAALREFERQKAITIQMSNTVVSSGSMSCKGGPTRAGGVEMETDYSCSVPIVIKAKVCTAKPASASKQ